MEYKEQFRCLVHGVLMQHIYDDYMPFRDAIVTNMPKRICPICKKVYSFGPLGDKAYSVQVFDHMLYTNIMDIIEWDDFIVEVLYNGIS